MYTYNTVPYYPYGQYKNMKSANGDRFFGLAPFLLGGLAGGALVAANRPFYPMPYPAFYPVPYPPYPMMPYGGYPGMY